MVLCRLTLEETSFYGEMILGRQNEWSEERSLSWELLQYESHNELQNFVADLNRFYKNKPAMYGAGL